ncbi:EF_hand domain-containing protein [Hexamita inflata]|uniref:EF_hand domain-containing protein n=1 Tax=Hexamita inflata TaxID=28002 RepID=A0ABP1HST2_9EUKA
MPILKPDVENCRQAFQAIDADSSGQLDQNELQKAFSLLQMNLTEQQIKNIVEIVDYDGSGQMSCEEFIHFVYICKNADPKDLKTILFLAADFDCAGTIDKKKLVQIFQKMNVKLSEGQIGDLFDTVADLNTRTISYELFVELMDRLMQ